MKKSGRILLTAELGREYGFKDVGGELIGPGDLEVRDPR